MRKKKKQKGKVWTKHSSLSLFLRIQRKQFWNLNLQQRAPAKNVTVFDMEPGEIASCPGTYWFEVFAFVFSFLFYIHILFYCELGDFLQKIFLSWNLGRRQHLDHFTQLSQTLSQRSQLQVKMDEEVMIIFLLYFLKWFDLNPQVGVAGLRMPVQHWVQRHVHSTPMPR